MLPSRQVSQQSVVTDSAVEILEEKNESSESPGTVLALETEKMALPVVLTSPKKLSPTPNGDGSTSDSTGCLLENINDPGASPSMTVDRNALRNFKEVSISNIALCYPAIQGDQDGDATVEQSDQEQQHTDRQGTEPLGISKVNALEQAENYLRKHQQQGQQHQLQLQVQQYQLLEQQHPSPSHPGNRSPLCLGGMAQIFESPNEQVPLGNSSSASPAAGGSVGTSPSPRPPLHRNLSGNALSSSGNFSLTPGAPTSTRNPSTIISPLARGRTNLSISSNPVTTDIAAAPAAAPPNQTLLEPLETPPSSTAVPAAIGSSSSGAPPVHLSPMMLSSPSPHSSSASPEKQQLLSLPSINSSST
jgi:hypothetical protein